MSRLKEAQVLLKDLGMPSAQYNERSALTLLALAGLGPKDNWEDAAQNLLRTVDIMEFIAEHYKKSYAPNSRETFRRQTLHQFVQARIADHNPDDPSRPTNSGNNCYGISDAALIVIKTVGTDDYSESVKTFLAEQGSLQEAYRKKRELLEVPLILPDGTQVKFSPGKHNELQVAIIEKMGPQFVPGSQVLYVGDTAKKYVVYEKESLEGLNIPITNHDKLPDVVLYQEENDWLIFVEAVTSHGPVSPKRYIELESMCKDCTSGRVYISAFPDRAEFRKYVADIAWETEVWIADSPGHMVHFNGPKFVGPYGEEN